MAGHMKILVGCSSPPDHGAGILTYAKELSESFLQLGMEVHFVSPPPKDWEWIRLHGIHHFSTTQDDDPVVAARQLVGYVSECQIDAVINNDNSLVQSISPAIPCPFVAVGHLGRTSIAALACFQPQWSDYIVAISNDMQRLYVTKHGVPLVKCPIIYNGIKDLGHDGNYSRRDSAALRVVYAGGYNRRLKGADLVLAAVRRSTAEWAGIRLDWYGGIPKKVARGLENLAHVRVHGRVPREELLHALRNADALLFPSRVEGCPMAMLEAMSLGVVPIASDGEGAMRYLITTGREGFACHLSQAATQILECLAHLRDQPGVLEEMKRAARVRFLHEFQCKRVADDLICLIRHPTIDRRHPPMRIKVLRWHRPLRPDGQKAPVVDRLFCRLGLLRHAGVLDLGNFTIAGNRCNDREMQ